MEHGRRPLYEPPIKRPEPENMERRGFLIWAGGVAALAGGKFVSDKIGEWQASKAERQAKDHSRQERRVENARQSLEQEKVTLRENINKGIQIADLSHQLINKYNLTLEEMQSLDSDDPRKIEFSKKLLAQLREIDALPHQDSGDVTVRYLVQASQYAEKLRDNPEALNSTATLFRCLKLWIDKSGTATAYEHNFAAGYWQLKKLKPEEIVAKFEKLVDFFDKHNIPKDNLLQEDLLYYLQDPEFDWNLDAAKMEALLDKRCPRWRETRATNMSDTSDGNRPYQKHNNDLAAFTIFELNRIDRMVSQLSNAQFREYLFAERDRDLGETLTELGGLIPLTATGRWPVDFKAREQVDNEQYTKPDEQAVLAPAFLMEYHLHATTPNIGDSILGPSAADTGRIIPGAVITSMKKDELAVHVYVSRRTKDYGSDMPRFGEVDVLSLGIIKRNAST